MKQNLSHSRRRIAACGVRPSRSPQRQPVASLLRPAPEPTARPAGHAHPLPTSLRKGLEQGFGSDFSSVRLHQDQEAQQNTRRLGAKAMTQGEHISFAEGAYQPGSAQGQRLLAHELAHVLQNRRAGISNVIRREPDPNVATPQAKTAEPDLSRFPLVAWHRANCPDIGVSQYYEQARAEQDIRREITDYFPALETSCFWIIGSKAGGYNCYGWCLRNEQGSLEILEPGDNNRPAERGAFLESFGYQQVSSPDEAQMTLYEGHVARKSTHKLNGETLWESKLGRDFPLILHRLSDLEGSHYGSIQGYYALRQSPAATEDSNKNGK